MDNCMVERPTSEPIDGHFEHLGQRQPVCGIRHGKFRHEDGGKGQGQGQSGKSRSKQTNQSDNGRRCLRATSPGQAKGGETSYQDSIQSGTGNR